VPGTITQRNSAWHYYGGFMLHNPGPFNKGRSLEGLNDRGLQDRSFPSQFEIGNSFLNVKDVIEFRDSTKKLQSLKW